MISLASLNSRFKIGTRINFGFLTVLVLLLVVSAVGYFGLDGSNRTFDQYVNTSDSSVRVLETDRNFTNMRRDAQVYVQSGDEQALKRVRDMGKTVRDALASMMAETTSQEPEGAFPPGRKTQLLAIASRGGEPHTLGLAMDSAHSLSFDPTGNHIAFAAGRAKSEIWVMENFLPTLKAARRR